VRVLVYPHSLAIGGSQINAIDLAAGVAEAGHQVLVYGVDGPLRSYVQERGLRFESARTLRYRPAPSRIAQLAGIVRRQRIDLIHAYEWPPCLDALYGAGLMCRVPIVCTVLGMTVMPYVPASMPLIMGTAGLGEEARRTHDASVWVLEPPIDIVNDHPGIDGDPFRAEHRIPASDLLVVTVSRLALDLKLDALVRAIKAADLLAGRFPIRLIVVGGGPAHDALQRRADDVNQRRRRTVVTLAGPALDPRPAYAAADVVVGMGSSSMRAMAIGKPVVVQGEEAFSLLFEPATLDYFMRHGFYGLGDGQPEALLLAGQVADLLSDAERRKTLGAFGRATIAGRFSLDRAVGIQLEIYRQVLAQRPRWILADAWRSARLALGLEFSNHDPRRKRAEKLHEQALLAAASTEPWPPTRLA
jgi:glycosyltransferase involved in cell wall biosynthesis